MSLTEQAGGESSAANAASAKAPLSAEPKEQERVTNMRTRSNKTQVLKLGSKYFGRTIRAFRLSLGILQEELAEKASVSVTVVGMIEREQSRLSEETLCSICLGLESEAGRHTRGESDVLAIRNWPGSAPPSTWNPSGSVSTLPVQGQTG